MKHRARAAAARAVARTATALGWIAAAAAGCARPGNPRGGIPDRRPPVVIATEPEPKAMVVNPDAEIRFRFNERISERPRTGTMDDAVLVSPATGTAHVEHGRDWISVKIDGGLKPKLAYRFTLLPVISDLFGNSMRDPFELVFTTGGRMIENAVAGQTLDRITGRPIPDLTVELLPPVAQPDTVAYVARSDERGLYFFRYLPPGSYNLVAYRDQNRNRALERRREPSGERRLLMTESPDTLLVDVAVLEPDTTPAAITRAEVVDSVTLRLTFTDYLDPEFLRESRIAITAPEGHAAPLVRAILHPADYDALKDTAKARAGRAGQPGVALAIPGQERGGLPPGLPLPKQEMIVQLEPPLEVNVEYRVSATAIVNINRIPTGRGDTTFVRKPPPARPAGAAPADSTRRAPGAAPPPNPTGAPPAAPPPDSAAARRDSAQVAVRSRR